jgi:Na+-translocating ferredoxin:NAD+ oxidoreductase RnfC subunit
MDEELVSDFDVDPAGIADALQAAGVAGAGGAGFPSYVKWQAIEDVNYLLMNHQESEPNYYADKWLARAHAEEFASFFDALLGTAFDVVVVGTKGGYRGTWTDELEAATGATVYDVTDLPVDVTEESGVVLVYTPDVYTYSEESVLLMVTAGVQLGDDLPTERGWIVHNTESLYNVSRALHDGTPVTRKYVHVDGNVPRHRCLEVPVGTPGTALLEAAGLEEGSVGADQVLADGGPGWCYEIDAGATEFGVRKRTNALLVLDRDVVDEHTQDQGQIDVLEAYDWTSSDHETEPTVLRPDSVRIPLITNAAYEGFVLPSEPTVAVGDRVSEGDVVARPASGGISNTQHASIDGEVVEFTDRHVVIEDR